MQSLQNTNNAITIVNQYLLEWNTPANNHKILILVEGKDDREFYYKFFLPANSEIKSSGGCGLLKGVYNHLQGKIKNIAIKDSDFARLCGIFPAQNNIFYADAHDYEMMCLKNEKTRKELFDNLAIAYDETLCDEIFQELSYLSYFKWFNYHNHLNYNFKAFKVEGVNATQLQNFNYIHTEILPQSTKRNRTITADELDGFKNSQAPCCKYELTNGHDFVQRFCHHLKSKALTTNQENEKSIRARLHPCFRLDAFTQTQLYQDIRNWESQNEVDILRKSE